LSHFYCSYYAFFFFWIGSCIFAQAKPDCNSPS
jgi:hypothetical protein